MKTHSHYDIALIHPPHTFHTEAYNVFPLPWALGHLGSAIGFGRYPIGPHWSDMPMGFFTMKNFIEKNSDYRVSIINLASLRFSVSTNVYDKFKLIHEQDQSFLSDLAEIMYPDRIRSTLGQIKADLFGVDLHWLIYSQGAIQILKLIKQIHPKSYVVLGGLTASYFSDEIMRLFPFIDFLIAGDGSVPLLELIKQVKGDKAFSQVPNLLYRENGKVKKGPKAPQDDYPLAESNDKLLGLLPTARGCPLQCIMCGGSKYALKNICSYKKARIYSVESLLKKILEWAKDNRGDSQPYLIHDPFVTLGKKKWEVLLNEIKNNRIKINFQIEFFLPHSRKDILNIAEKLPGSSIHISPESIDENVRAYQKNIRYSNADLLKNMDTIRESNCLSMFVWFMAGLAKDTKKSVSKTVDFVRNYYKKITNPGKDRIIYTELLFIDPGSLAFQAPQDYGYELLHKSFLQHMESFEIPIFKYQINYRNRHCSRDELFDLFLYVHNEMNQIYYDNDIISKQFYERLSLYNFLLKKYSPMYDKAMLTDNVLMRNRHFEATGKLFRAELEKSSKKLSQFVIGS